MTALDDRRQRAQEAGQDAMFGRALSVGNAAYGIDAAIETAIRVRVDDDIAEAGCAASEGACPHLADARVIIEAAFRAAGFEVEQ